MHVSLLRPRFVTLALASAALALSLSPGRLRAAENPPTAPVKADGFSFVKTVGAISEYQLAANGLAVLLLPATRSPARPAPPTSSST
jgi:zinc protease